MTRTVMLGLRIPSSFWLAVFYLCSVPGCAAVEAGDGPQTVPTAGVPSVHHKHGFHKRFDHAEEWSKKFDDPARDKWQMPDQVIAALKIAPSDKIADIGAGTGYFSLRIAKAFPQAKVYATDVEDDMVSYMLEQTRQRKLENHKPIKIQPASANLPEKVNLAIVVDTYHHIDDRIEYFAHLRNVLAPRGRVAIIDFTAESPEGPPAEHRISPEQMRDEMQKAGYRLDEKVELLPYQYFLIFTPANE